MDYGGDNVLCVCEQVCRQRNWAATWRTVSMRCWSVRMRGLAKLSSVCCRLTTKYSSWNQQWKLGLATLERCRRHFLTAQRRYLLLRRSMDRRCAFLECTCKSMALIVHLQTRGLSLFRWCATIWNVFGSNIMVRMPDSTHLLSSKTNETLEFWTFSNWVASDGLNFLNLVPC